MLTDPIDQRAAATTASAGRKSRLDQRGARATTARRTIGAKPRTESAQRVAGHQVAQEPGERDDDHRLALAAHHRPAGGEDQHEVRRHAQHLHVGHSRDVEHDRQEPATTRRRRTSRRVQPRRLEADEDEDGVQAGEVGRRSSTARFERRLRAAPRRFSTAADEEAARVVPAQAGGDHQVARLDLAPPCGQQSPGVARRCRRSLRSGEVPRGGGAACAARGRRSDVRPGVDGAVRVGDQAHPGEVVVDAETVPTRLPRRESTTIPSSRPSSLPAVDGDRALEAGGVLGDDVGGEELVVRAALLDAQRVLQLARRAASRPAGRRAASAGAPAPARSSSFSRTRSPRSTMPWKMSLTGLGERRGGRSRRGR